MLLSRHSARLCLLVILAILSWPRGVSARPADRVVDFIRLDYTPAALTQLATDGIARAQKAIDTILAVPDAKRTFENTILAFEQMNAEADNWTEPLELLTVASTDKAVQAAAGEAGDKVSAFFARVYARPDLYHAMQVAGAHSQVHGEDARLLAETLRTFKRSGAGLDAHQRDELTALKDELTKAETDFSRNLAQANDTVELTAADVEGLSADFVGGLKKTDHGTFLLTLLDASQYIPFMENARHAEARHKVLAARERVAATVNVPLLEKAIALRTRIARLMGYPNHAAYVLEGRMAKTPERVRAFLDGLKGRLAVKAQAEMAALLALKKKDDATATVLDAWDVPYYQNQQQKTRYAVDAEKVRAYFPVDHVLKAVFDVYQTLLGVKFQELSESSPESHAVADRWATGLRLFEVRDAAGGQRLGFFFLDLYPRANKYKHFAAFTLRSGRQNTDGTYQAPVAGIVGNFPAPRADHPALLRHNEVETFFHEFGHIMHKLLTEAKYTTLSGSSVRRDFVEAPSQMLENWVWNRAVLKRLSAHYQSGQPLPDALIDKMLAARYATSGIFYSRQLMYARIDLDYHTAGETVDTTAIWNRDKKELTGLEPLPGSQPQATFGHLMGGYDAGYYGYLWSKVYAEDMFTVFEQAGVTDPGAGRRYRAWILARGNTADPDVLLQGFLGRPPDSRAFYKSLGL